jgi:hypothetical protein
MSMSKSDIKLCPPANIRFVGCPEAKLPTIHVGFVESDFPARELDERGIWRLVGKQDYKSACDAFCFLHARVS